MPRKAKQTFVEEQSTETSIDNEDPSGHKVQRTEPTETSTDETKSTFDLPRLSKDEIKKAKETLARAKKERSDKPKRKCSEKQLAALAAGRMKNPRLNKSKKED